jgi:hypothetical protein
MTEYHQKLQRGQRVEEMIMKCTNIDPDSLTKVGEVPVQSDSDDSRGTTYDDVNRTRRTKSDR